MNLQTSVHFCKHIPRQAISDATGIEWVFSLGTNFYMTQLIYFETFYIVLLAMINLILLQIFTIYTVSPK